MTFLIAASPHSVAVDLSALDRQSYTELDAVGLERALVVRLVQEGFAVVAAGADPEVKIRVTRSGRTVELRAGERSAMVEVDLKRLREFHLEAAQKVAELARTVAKELPAPDAPPPPAPVPEPSPRVPELPLWNVLAAGGILLRAPGVDGRAVVAVRYAATRMVGLHLEVGLSPVLGALTAFDAGLLLGAGLVMVRTSALRLEVGLSLGVALHSFAFEVVGSEERFGSRVDFVARPFARVTVNPIAGLLLWAQAGAGISSRAREHRLLGEVVYARGALCVDVVAGAGWEL